MDNKQKTLIEIFEATKSLGKCSSKKEFAELVGVNDKSMTRALNGDSVCLTDGLLKKAIQFQQKLGIEPQIKQEKIPLLPLQAHGGSLTDYREDGCLPQDCEWVTSPVRGAEFAIQVTGDSMAPEYPNGCLVLIRRVDPNAFLEWGKTYVLDTDNGIVIKELRPCDDGNKVECHSLNPDAKYHPYTIDRVYVKGWYRVLMQMSLK